MSSFEHAMMRALRQLYDVKAQIVVTLPVIGSAARSREFDDCLAAIAAKSVKQVARLDDMFRVLYSEPRGEASWVATALLREAWDLAKGARTDAVRGCAASLLALKRYELTLMESLLRWSEQCDLVEALPGLRRSIAEELVLAAALSELAYEPSPARIVPLPDDQRPALH